MSIHGTIVINKQVDDLVKGLKLLVLLALYACVFLIGAILICCECIILLQLVGQVNQRCYLLILLLPLSLQAE